MFTPEMMLPTGPPPQAVLDQRWLWHLLLILLGVTFLLRLIGLDIAGALLSGLMLCFGIIMTRDGMQEMAKYALVYAVLCGLNFFFDILPLITELGGRISRTTEPVAASSSVEGVHQTTYTLTTKTTPFFDSDQGILYNVQSLAMVVSPICMGLGVYLAISANNEIQRSVPNLFDENVDFAPRQPAPLDRGPASRLGGTGGAAQRSVGGSSSGAASSSRTGGSSVRDGFERFQGQAHKLG